MLNAEQVTQLKENWGEKVDAMACYAVARVYHPGSYWACYLLAMDPEDSDTIACIVDGETLEVCDWSYKELLACYDEQGEPPKLDEEYRPRRAAELFKRVSEERNDSYRN